MTDRLLLDSMAYLWWHTDRSRLKEPVIEAIAEAETVYLSIVTPWELELKQGLNKLDLPAGLWDRLDEDGFSLVDVTLQDTFAAARLPPHHRDPFDRMIIAQAQRRGLTVVTSDRHLAEYGVPILFV